LTKQKQERAMAEQANIAAGLLDRNRERCPHKAAYLCGEDVLTHLALAAEAARFANLLRGRGVGPGDRVVLALPDSFAAVKAFLGTMLLSACPVPVNTMLTREDFAFVLADCEAAALITTEDSPAMLAAKDVSGLTCVLPCGLDGPWGLADFSSEFEALAPHPDAPGFMLYSSGSTGRPKGVPHAQADLLEPVKGWGTEVLGVREDDILFSASKLSFAYGLMSSVSLPLAAGATAVLLPGKPGPDELFSAIARHRPSLFFCVPTLYSMLLRCFEPGKPDSDLSSLRLCYSAGEALPEASVGSGSSTPASRSSTASAPPRLSICSCPTARAKCAAGPAACSCPASRRASWTRRARTCPTARPATCGYAAPAPAAPTGSGPRRPPRPCCPAAGWSPATSTCARMGCTGTAVAATTC